jgi:hypothetical protein
MEVIMNLCVGRKVTHEGHAGSAQIARGEKTTKDLLGKTFYWLEMKEDV